MSGSTSGSDGEGSIDVNEKKEAKYRVKKVKNPNQDRSGK